MTGPFDTHPTRCLAYGSGDPNGLVGWPDYLAAIARQQGWTLIGMLWDRRVCGSDDLIDTLDSLGVDVVLCPTLVHLDNDVERLSGMVQVWTAEPFARWQQTADRDPEKLADGALEPGMQFPTVAHVADLQRHDELASLTWRRAGGSMHDATVDDSPTENG